MPIDTTVVVPTYNEADNVHELARRLDDAFADRPVEILFVDDSTDHTPDVIAALERRAVVTAGAGDVPVPGPRASVRLIRRDGPARTGGLAGAVTEGILQARGRYVVVMDGDLQHPPEMAPLLRDRAEAEALDMVVASRYAGSGDAAGLASSWRRSVSSGSTLLTRALFPRRVGAKSTDPMTGFFCVRRDAVDVSRLRPRGFKILLEILASHDLTVRDVPFVFGERLSGESKASWANGVRFLHQVLSLRATRPVRFAAVGALGLVVNLVVMALLLRLGAGYVLASVVATECAIVHNFLLQERFVFAAHLRTPTRHGWWQRAWRCAAYNNLDTLARVPLLVLLVERLGLHSLPAQALTLVVSFGARFLYTSRVVYGRQPAGRRAAHLSPAAAPTGTPVAGAAPGWLRPPGDDEKDAYLAAPQHRWVFWAGAVAFLGVLLSFAGLAAQRYWTALFFVPMVLLCLEQVVSLRTSTLRRRVTLPDHRFLVETYAPAAHPSVDVFLPTAGEDLAVLANTYRYVAGLQWPGRLLVHVLDDAGRPEVAALAQRHGFGYLARAGSEFKKAGNLQHAFERTDGDLVLLLDADFVPRHDLLLETVPYFSEAGVGVVQTPQYFSTRRSLHWLERCAGATQELFFRHIQPSRDAVGAAICVGTSAVYRRAALESIGGFPLIGHSEDVFTGVLLGRAGYELQYVPVLLSRGRCPDDVRAFLAQQYRWCEGSMALLADRSFHDDRTMTGMQRLSFWAGFLYYVTTAVNAVVAPLPILVMVLFFPENIAATNMLPLVGVLLLWLVVLPLVSRSRWRVDVLRVQTLYGYAHLLCIADMLRGRATEWVPTGAAHGGSGAASRGSVAGRVSRFMVPWLLGTQLVVLAGLAHGAVVHGLQHVWANIVFALLGAYVFVPVAVHTWRALGTGTPVTPPVQHVATGPAVVIDLREPAVAVPAGPAVAGATVVGGGPR